MDLMNALLTAALRRLEPDKTKGITVELRQTDPKVDDDRVMLFEVHSDRIAVHLVDEVQAVIIGDRIQREAEAQGMVLFGISEDGIVRLESDEPALAN
jgi:hypothetical protein